MRRPCTLLPLPFIVAMLPASAAAQRCEPAVVGGVVVTEGRGGTRGSIAASALGVVVGWEELERPRPDYGLGASDPPFTYYARRLDRTTLAPQGAAVRITSRSQSPEHPAPGPVAAMPDGTLAAPYCYCMGGSGESGCRAALVAGSTAPSFRPTVTRGGGCGRGRPVVTGAGGNGLLISTSAEMDATLVYSTARASPSMHRLIATDAMAAATLDATHAVLVAREADGVHALVIDQHARFVGADTVLSATDEAVGAPAVTSVDGAALVAFAARRGGAPWRLELVTWRAGQRPTRALVTTGVAPALAPALAPSSQAGCAILSWTEGMGRGTVARAGRVCRGVLDPASVAQLSRPGVEAGDTELATDGANVFAAWHEIDRARGHAAVELRATALRCH